jgi:hypothetical protein
VRFLRHLAAAALVVAGVVLLGLAWSHFAPGSLVGSRAPANQAVVSGRPAGSGVGTMNLGLSSMLNPVSLAVLRHTVVIEGIVIALVVMADVSRGLWRQERRARRLAKARSARSGDDEGTER